jgi:hypothetical protein
MTTLTISTGSLIFDVWCVIFIIVGLVWLVKAFR